MDNKNNKLINGKIMPALLSFAIPFLFSFFLQTLYGAVDLYVVGKYTNPASVSAVAIGSQIMQIPLSIINGISMGGTVLIGRKIGEGNEKGACKSVGNITSLFALFALCLTPVMFVGINSLVSIMQTPAEAVEYCKSYLGICCLGLPFIIGYNGVSSIYRGTGDSKTPVYFIILATVINISLDFLLTGYFGLGVKGAAFATITAQGLSFIGALIYIKLGGFKYRIKSGDLKLSKDITEVIFKVGIPLALQDVLVHFSFMAISAITNTLGVNASAAVGVDEKILGFAFIIPSSFGAAVATMAAQNIGANRRDRAVKTTLCGMGLAACFGVLIFLVCNTTPGILVSIFTKDAEVVMLGASYIRMYSFDCILTAFIFTVNSFLSANQKSLFCFIHSMIATFLVRLPATYFLKVIFNGSLFAIGFAAPAASIVSIVICCIFIYSNRKELLG